MKSALVVVGSALLLAACDRGDLADRGRLVGPTWTLRELQQSQAAGAAVPPGDAFRARFDDTGRLSVAADCNSCGGGFEAADGRLRVGALACTRVYCVATAPLDTEYVAQLEAAQSYAVDTRTLTIRTGRGVLVFAR
ncbi:MAG TPA: META domain-containing protein [Vicinamibacteria bacterium]|jgi:heat shock protein HslJ